MERERERGRRGKEREREREREREKEPGPSGAQQRDLCASARPSRAQRRVEDEGGERRRGGGGPTGKGPGLGAVAGPYIPKNRLHIDLGLGRRREAPATLPLLSFSPSTLPPSIPPKTEQGSALNKQLYKHWWSLSETATLNTEVLRWKEEVRARDGERGATCGDFCGGKKLAGSHDGDKNRLSSCDLLIRF